MSETKKVNVPLLLLCGVFLVAVIVAITMAAQRNSLSAEVTELQQQIAEEQATWQAIAAEKEELQATLTETENALKEAQLSLEEATARKAELETEVEELTASNEAATAGDCRAYHPEGNCPGGTDHGQPVHYRPNRCQDCTGRADCQPDRGERSCGKPTGGAETQQEALSSQVETLTTETSS